MIIEKNRTVSEMDYPPALYTRTGARVGWRGYATRPEADDCARVARVVARNLERKGFDFGMCSPGEVIEVSGKFETCVP